MKIRAGFVSNSSSTSFLIIAKSDLNRSDFFELMGIAPDSPIADLFDQFYEDVIENTRIEIDFKTTSADMRPEYLFKDDRDHLSEHMVAKIREAKKKGLKAYYGWLDSESTPIQTFFCTDSFEVENEKIYFNGLENVW
jgi:hypothetical protein